MKILLLNDSDEIMDTWFIGSDSCISSNDVFETLNERFILADSQEQWNEKLTVAFENFELD